VEYLLNGLPIGAVYALVALSYSLIYASSGVLNWSQGDMVMLGAYVGFTLSQILHVGFIPSLLVSMLVVGFVGVVVQRLILRPLRQRKSPPINVVIATLGVAIIVRNIALTVWGPDAQNYPSPVRGAPLMFGTLSITRQDILILCICMLMMLALRLFLGRTRDGKALRAVAQDRYAAVLMGVDTARSDAIAFGASAAIGAVAGILIAPLYFVTFNMGSSFGLKGFVAAVIGGLGNISGAIAGGFFLGILEALAGGLISSGYRDAITFTVLILVLWLRPSGLFLRKTEPKV
jgi:branched-chain amino acid transport system permease protein